jgi:myo-inositol-1(or 4)-monophosphatase
VDAPTALELLFRASTAAKEALGGLADWGPSGERAGQYRLDLVADRAVLEVLSDAGLSVLSEESGYTGGRSTLLAVVDPIDGSTNAHRGLPMYSTSICVLDEAGPWLGTVVDHTSGRRYHAIRGSGAWRDGVPISPSNCDALSRAVVGISGVPPANIGSWQYRALGCASLELCAVADGTLDAYLLVGGATLHPWDYLAGLLICKEAGASIAELRGQDPWIRVDAPRCPAAAATRSLLEQLTRRNV